MSGFALGFALCNVLYQFAVGILGPERTFGIDPKESALEEWRESGICCCIILKSDHNLAWDVSWVYANDPEHYEHYLGYSVEGDIEDAAEAGFHEAKCQMEHYFSKIGD